MLIRLDFPTFDRPKKAISGILGSGQVSMETADVVKSTCFTRALAMIS